jgi:pimeloyl-ACP methyl ester carboxylesterase
MTMAIDNQAWQQAQQLAEPVCFELNWGSVRGLAWGDKQAKPLLALHGWLDNAHSFLPIAAVFLSSSLAQSHRLIAVDWAGHGHSDHRPAGNYYPFIDYVYDLWQLCEQQGWVHIDVVAHSMGAYAANMLAGIDPMRIQNLLMVEAFGLLATPAEETAKDMRKGFISRWQQQQKQPPHYPDLETGVRARQAAGDFSKEIAALLVERGIDQLANGEFRFRADGQLRGLSPVRLTADQIGHVLSEISCNIELILGEQGHTRLLKALELWQHKVPQLKIHRLQGGHHVHMEQSAAVISLFEQMVDRANG